MNKLWRWWINPEVRAKFHLTLAIMWTIAIIPIMYFGWYLLIAFLSFISLYAIIMGHISSYEANQSELISKRQIEGEFDDLDKESEKLEDLLERKKQQQKEA